MARTYDDLLKFQAMYGIPPEKSAGAFGVALPAPSPTGAISDDAWVHSEGGNTEYRWGDRFLDPSMREERPILPPAPEPVLVAGNEKKPAEGMLDAPPVQMQPIDIVGEDDADRAAAAALGMNGGRTLPPWEQARAATQAEGVKSGMLNPNSELVTGAVPGKPQPKKDGGIDKATQADLEAAQALEANTLGAGAPRRAAGLSPGQSMAAVDGLTGFNRSTHEQNVLQQEDADKAQAGVFDAKADAAIRVGKAFATLAATDRNAAAAEEARLRAEEARQAQAEKEIRDAEARIMAKPKDGEKFIGMIGSLFSYALSAIGNANVAGTGGTPTNTIQAMMAREDANEDKEYQRKLERLKSLKIDASQKDAKVRQLEADKIAAYARRRENAIQGFQSVYAANEAGLNEAQKKAFQEGIMAFRGQQMEALQSGRDALAYKIQQQSAQAAQNPFSQWTKADKEASTKHAESFIPTDDKGNGYTVPAGVYPEVSKMLAKRAERDQLLREQEADARIVASQSIGDRSEAAIKGVNAALNRLNNRGLKIATIENVMSGNGAMSKDEAVMQLDTKAYGDPTSIRTDVVNGYIDNLVKARHESDRQKEQIARQFGGMKGKRAIVGPQMYFIPQGLNEGPSQNAPEGVSKIRGR